MRAKLYQEYRDTVSIKDSAKIEAGYRLLIQKRAHDKYVRDHKKIWNRNTGKPINKTEFGQWTDITTPRWPSLVENTFGEPIQLHQDYLLLDVLRNRPVIVEYRWVGSYVVEAIIMLLFVLGMWFARRSRFFWLAFSFFAFDMFIHLVLGFGINEIYIMSPHYLFIIPLGIAYLLKALNVKPCVVLRLTILVITLYLVIYNCSNLLYFLI